jgi:hypothetical protein
MSAAFGRLLAIFGHSLPDADAARVDAVVDVCELIDRYIDSHATEAERLRASDAVDATLGGDVGGVPDELESALHTLAASFDDPVRARADLARICAAGARAQRTRRRSIFVEAVREEGRAFSALFVPLIAPHTDARFVGFFLDLGETANLLDKLVDARVDRARGELSLRPGVRHHARLGAEIARDTASLLRRVPSRRAFARWAAWFLNPANHESRARPS